MIDTDEMTGAEAGIRAEHQIQIALQEMVVLGGEATSSQLYIAIERNLPLGVKLSQQGRDTLRSLINREAVNRGYVAPYNSAQRGWRITPLGRMYLDSIQGSLGTEEEEILPNEPEISIPPAEGAINHPFDPSTIRVDQRMMSTFEVMRKILQGDIELQPDFQRNIVWNLSRQDRLIESLLLRIPLPAFYLDATNDDTWMVVDGLQRLSTIRRFCFEEKDLGEEQPLVLGNLEFLTELNGRRFANLSRSQQRIIEDTELNLYIIRPETSPQVKFTIFSRVNTSGLVLTSQEIRHALFQGRSTKFLEELSQTQEFLSATTESINPSRMDDRECILRYLAFQINGYEQYGRIEQRDQNGRLMRRNLDGLLSNTMVQLNDMSESELLHLREGFIDVMRKAEAVFGQYAFRKLYQRNAKRTQISKPLFEVWSVLLHPYILEVLQSSREAIIDGFITLMNDVEFNKAISLGTGSVRNVQTRFRRVKQLLEEKVA